MGWLLQSRNMTSLGEKVWTIPEESEPNSTWGGSVGLGLLGAHGEPERWLWQDPSCCSGFLIVKNSFLLPHPLTMLLFCLASGLGLGIQSTGLVSPGLKPRKSPNSNKTHRFKENIWNKNCKSINIQNIQRIPTSQNQGVKSQYRLQWDLQKSY